MGQLRVLTCVLVSLFCVTGETERGLRVQLCAALPVPKGKSAQPPSQPTVSPLCVGPGRLPSPHTEEYTVYAREAAKTFSLGSRAHTNFSCMAGVRTSARRLCGCPSDWNAFPLWDMWASPWTTLGRSLWNLSVCGRFPMWHEARLAFGPLKNVVAASIQLPRHSWELHVPIHPTLIRVVVDLKSPLPFIDRMLRKSGTESSSVVTGATDTEKAAEQADQRTTGNARRKTASRKRERERKRERTGGERRRGEDQKRGP